MARRLGKSLLADELAQVIKQASTAEIPAQIQALASFPRELEVVRVSGEHESLVILPRHACVRLRHKLGQRFPRLARAYRGLLNPRTQL
jgi:hypothetical protein